MWLLLRLLSVAPCVSLTTVPCTFLALLSTDLNTAGLAMRAAGEVGAAVRQLDILLLPSVYIPGTDSP
jgi:hypothetical protein